jgi:hypothetical protein
METSMPFFATMQEGITVLIMNLRTLLHKDENCNRKSANHHKNIMILLAKGKNEEYEIEFYLEEWCLLGCYAVWLL